MASSISNCDEILIRHPEWVKGSRVSRRLVLDHSNTNDWKGDLVVSHVNLPMAWKLGILEAQKLCVQAQIDFEPSDVASLGITTLLKPNGRVIGVTERQFDWSMVEMNDAQNLDETTGTAESSQDETGNNDDALTELIEVSSARPQNYLNVDGKNVFKATILKEMNKDTPLSNDRLRKVRGMSKFCGDEQRTSVNVDDMISVGDPLVVCEANKLKLVIIISLKDGDAVVQYIARVDLERISTSVQVRELEMVEVETNLFSTGKYLSEPTWISGKNVLVLNLKLAHSHLLDALPIISTNS